MQLSILAVCLLDPLDWIHAVTAHIPDRGQHCVRYFGAPPTAPDRGQPNNSRVPRLPARDESPDTTADFARRRRASWGRWIQRIFEVDPCSVGVDEMKIAPFITDPRIVDRFLY